MKSIINITLITLLFGCSSPSSKFELCCGGLHPYYHPELKYKGEFYAIKRAFHDNYKNVESTNNSGIVRIRFHVNCKGNTGNFEVETYDLAYQKSIMDSQISNQLLQLTQELDGWIPAVEEDGETVNSHKFLSFRIENGVLTDILPK